MSEKQRKKRDKKIASQNLGKATYDAPTEKCVEMDKAVKDLIKEQNKEGEINA